MIEVALAILTAMEDKNWMTRVEITRAVERLISRRIMRATFYAHMQEMEIAGYVEVKEGHRFYYRRIK